MHIDRCKNYAAKYDVMFNGNKRQLIIYKCTSGKPHDSNIYISNINIPCVKEVIHLGPNLNEDMIKFNALRCVAECNCQCNMYFAYFKYANTNIRNMLFHKYCTAFYGNHVLSMFNSCMEDIYIAHESSYMQCMESSMDYSL